MKNVSCVLEHDVSFHELIEDIGLSARFTRHVSGQGRQMRYVFRALYCGRGTAAQVTLSRRGVQDARQPVYHHASLASIQLHSGSALLRGPA